MGTADAIFWVSHAFFLKHEKLKHNNFCVSYFISNRNVNVTFYVSQNIFSKYEKRKCNVWGRGHLGVRGPHLIYKARPLKKQNCVKVIYNLAEAEEGFEKWGGGVAPMSKGNSGLKGALSVFLVLMIGGMYSHGPQFLSL